jgi:hypothetical protein
VETTPGAPKPGGKRSAEPGAFPETTGTDGPPKQRKDTAYGAYDAVPSYERGHEYPSNCATLNSGMFGSREALQGIIGRPFQICHSVYGVQAS